MNQNQELKMRLLEKYGDASDKKSIDFCREAYKFIVEGDMIKLAGFNAITGEVFAERFPFTPTSSEPVAVDLGLPSGTLWCDRNVGAKSVEDYGAYISWGNTFLHYPKRKNDWGDDIDSFDCEFDFGDYEKTEGNTLKGDIDLAHDAARINMGEPWKMPTSEQFKELYDNCTWERKTVNGVNGYLATSKINGNSVFFPAAGYGRGTSVNYVGSYGRYWSSSWYSASRAYRMSFNSSSVNPQNSSYRYFGFAVRAVQ